MSKERYSLPQRTHIADTRHKYVVNERVRCINAEHAMYGREGVIIAPMPWCFQYPAYDVLWDGRDKVMAMSERSIERIEVQNA